MALPDGHATRRLHLSPVTPHGNPPDLEAREHDLTMHVFTVSAGMAGMGAIFAVIAYAIF
jgi:hypothetical protein